MDRIPYAWERLPSVAVLTAGAFERGMFTFEGIHTACFLLLDLGSRHTQGILRHKQSPSVYLMCSSG